jgi:O-antigen/teichoic acid export membrane protein
LFRNASVVAVAQAITWTATFLFTVAQARYLSPTGFGELSLALSYAIVMGVVVDFGLSTKLARDVAQRPATAGKALAASLVVRACLWGLAMPLVWVGTVALGYHTELQATILILGSSLLFAGVAASLGAYFQGREEFVFRSLGSVVQRGSAAALGVALLAMGQGIVVMAIVYLVSQLLQVLVMVPGMRRYPVSSMTLERGASVGMFRGAATLGVFWILGAIYGNVGIVILERLAPPENVAWFAAAYRLFNAAVMGMGLVIGAVLYPALSRLAVGPRDALRRAMETWFAILLASGVFTALALVMAADQAVALLYPKHQYAEAATTLRLLAPGLAGMYANGVFFLALLGLGLERRLLVMAAALAVLTPIANLLAIPLLQHNGTALITSGTEAVILVWVLAATPADLRGAANPRVVVKVLVAATPAAACLWWLRDEPVLIAISLAAAIYVAALLALKTVPGADMAAVRGFRRKRTRRGADALEAGPAVAHGTAEP